MSFLIIIIVICDHQQNETPWNHSAGPDYKIQSI